MLHVSHQARSKCKGGVSSQCEHQQMGSVIKGHLRDSWLQMLPHSRLCASEMLVLFSFDKK